MMVSFLFILIAVVGVFAIAVLALLMLARRDTSRLKYMLPILVGLFILALFGIWGVLKGVKPVAVRAAEKVESITHDGFERPITTVGSGITDGVEGIVNHVRRRDEVESADLKAIKVVSISSILESGSNERQFDLLIENQSDRRILLQGLTQKGLILGVDQSGVNYLLSLQNPDAFVPPSAKVRIGFKMRMDLKTEFKGIQFGKEVIGVE